MMSFACLTLRCANAQPFLCNESGPLQATLGNFQAILGNSLGPFQAISLTVCILGAL